MSKSNHSFKSRIIHYHAKFGNRAFKCKSPCTFRSFKNHSVTTITKTVPLTQSMILPKVYDKLSKQMFLIDSGACGNFLPVSDDQAEEVESHFYDASGNPIKCFGNVTLDVDIGFGKISDVFCICAIEQPILGFEFLQNHKITLDASTCFLKCENSKKQVNTLQGPINSYDFFPAHEIRCTGLLQGVLVFQLQKKKIKAIRNFKRPKSVKSLRRFTGIGSVLCSINTKFIS